MRGAKIEKSGTGGARARSGRFHKEAQSGSSLFLRGAEIKKPAVEAPGQEVEDLIRNVVRK